MPPFSNTSVHIDATSQQYICAYRCHLSAIHLCISMSPPKQGFPNRYNHPLGLQTVQSAKDVVTLIIQTETPWTWSTEKTGLATATQGVGATARSNPPPSLTLSIQHSPSPHSLQHYTSDWPSVQLRNASQGAGTLKNRLIYGTEATWKQQRGWLCTGN